MKLRNVSLDGATVNTVFCFSEKQLANLYSRNDITTFAPYARHGSEWILSP